MVQSSTTTKLVDAAGVNRAKIGAGGDLAVSLSNPAAAPYGIFASLNPYGGLRVSAEPTTVFFDPFDGFTIDTVRWVAAGTQVPIQANGAVALNANVGVNVANNSVLTSVPTFVSPGVGFLVYSGIVTLEAAQINAVNVHRFWGKGVASAFAYATPLTDGIGFEVDGATGALQCVVYIAGTKYVVNSTTPANISSSIAGAGGAGTALPTGASGSNYGAALPWRGGAHRFAIMARSDIVYWFIEGQDVPVAALSYATPNVQGLPLRFHSITNNAATSLAHTFQLGAFAINDSTAQNQTLSDGTYQFRKAQIGASGALSVKGGAVAGQTLAVAANTPVTGNALNVSEAGNVSFIVKNTLPATAYQGNPVVVFEQSDDGVSWAPLPVVSTMATGAVFTGPITLPAGVANTSIIFDAGLEGVNWVRARVTTAPSTSGMTIVMAPGGMAFEPAVATMLPTQPASTVVTAAAAVSTAATATTPTPPAGQYVYVTGVQVTAYATAAITGGAAPTNTASTNLGGLIFTFQTAYSAAGQTAIESLQATPPLRGTAPGTAVSITAPLTTNVIWRITISYYIGY